MVGGVWVQKWSGGGYGSSSEVFVLLLCLILFSSLHLVFGSPPGSSGVGTHFYQLPMDMEFTRSPDPPESRH